MADKLHKEQRLQEAFQLRVCPSMAFQGLVHKHLLEDKRLGQALVRWVAGNSLGVLPIPERVEAAFLPAVEAVALGPLDPQDLMDSEEFPHWAVEVALAWNRPWEE